MESSTPLPTRAMTDGDAAAPPLVLLHGFTQTSSSWTSVAGGLAATGRRVLTVDLPGHGRAEPVLDSSDLATTAAMLATTAERAVYVGYSMGGRVALRLALDRPESVEALVLVGSTAGIDDPVERLARRRSDAALADHIESVGTAAFLEEWFALPLFDGFRPDDADAAARRRNRAAGLAASLRSSGTSTMDPPWWAELPRLDMPVLVVHGEHDTKFATLGHRLAEGIGRTASLVSVPGTGHATHLQAPHVFPHVVSDWLGRIRPRSPAG